MLADAGALLVVASSANAGITIPAGDWTVDIGGNVNAYFTNKDTKYSGSVSAGGYTIGGSVEPKDGNTIGTGLLPSALGIGAKSRQNDLDVAFQFTFFTGGSSGTGAAGGSNTLNIRQAFLTFGDASWGQVKLGRDLGIFGSDAILSDMTLLGVGVSGLGSTAAGGNSTLGRIGSGYIYADWVGQAQYQSPNFNGLQFTAAVREPFSNGSDTTRNDMGYDAKVTYDWAGDVSGRVYLGAISQKNNAGTYGSYTSRGVEFGAKVNVAHLGLNAHYYDGKGLDSQNTGTGGLVFGGGQKTDDRGGYVQATYVIPTGTKLGLSWGQNKSESERGSLWEIENRSWIVGAYHPLTKSLNLVAEYTDQEVKANATSGGVRANGKVESQTVSLGAILFF
jgi:predicted porin